MADRFIVPPADYSWLSQLPEQYAKGEEIGRDAALRKAFAAGDFSAPGGGIDYGKMFSVAAQSGSPEFALQAARLQAEDAYRRETMKPQIQRDYEWMQGGGPGAAGGAPSGPAPTASAQGVVSQMGQQPPTQPTNQAVNPREQFFQALHPQFGISPGQKAVDAKFAPDLIQWEGQGQGEVEAGLASLKHAKSLLDAKDSNVSGPGIGFFVKKSLAGNEDLSTIAARKINPEAFNTAQAHQRVLVATLRPLVGARAAQQLFQSILQTTYDPMALPSENSRRLGLVIKNIEKAAKNKQAMADYFRQHNGTLEGYSGEKFDPDTFDFTEGLDDQTAAPPEETGSPVPGATQITTDPRGGLQTGGMNRATAPDGTRITNGQQTLEKRNGQWVPVQ